MNHALPCRWAWNSTADASHHAVWVADDLFGTAVRCGGADGADDGATLSISRLHFGRAGPWAVNMWVRQADNAGSAFQYLLSTAHTGGMSNDSVFEPNQARPCCCRPSPQWSICMYHRFATVPTKPYTGAHALWSVSTRRLHQTQ